MSSTTTGIATTPGNDFLNKLHQMLDEADLKGHSHIVSWYEDGKSFQIDWVSDNAMPIIKQYFHKTKKFTSFRISLWNYGFERTFAKISDNKGIEEKSVNIWRHPLFQRNCNDLISRMKKKKKNNKTNNDEYQAPKYKFSKFLEINEKTRREHIRTILGSPMILGQGGNIGIFEYEKTDEETYILDTAISIKGKKSKSGFKNKINKNGTEGTYALSTTESKVQMLKWNIPIKRPLKFDLLEQYLKSKPEYANENDVRNSGDWNNLVRATMLIYRCKVCRNMTVITMKVFLESVLGSTKYSGDINNERCFKCINDFHYDAVQAELDLCGLNLDTSEEDFYCYENLKMVPCLAKITVSYNNCNCDKKDGGKRCDIPNVRIHKLYSSLMTSKLDQRDAETGTYFCTEYKKTYRFTTMEIGSFAEHYIFKLTEDFFEQIGIKVVLMYSGEGGQADLILAIPTEDDVGKKIYELLFSRIQAKAILYTDTFKIRDKKYSDDVIMAFLRFEHHGLGSDVMNLDSVSICKYETFHKFANERAHSKSGNVQVQSVRHDILNDVFNVPSKLVGAVLFSLHVQSKSLLSFWEAKSPRKTCVNAIAEHECHMQSVKTQSEFYVFHQSDINYLKWDDSINMLVEWWPGFKFNSELYDVVDPNVIKCGVRYVWIRLKLQSKSWKDKSGLVRHRDRPPAIYMKEYGIHAFLLYDHVGHHKTRCTISLIPWNLMCAFIKPKRTDYSKVNFNKVAKLMLRTDDRKDLYDLTFFLDQYQYGWNEAIPLSLLTKVTGIPQKRFGKISIDDVQPVKYNRKADLLPKMSKICYE